MNMIFSRRLAIAIGIVLPLAETLRAILSGVPISLQLDHYLMGAFLLYGAWRCRKYDIIGQRYIIAAWAFSCGIGYMILQRNVEEIFNLGTSQISNIWTVVFIGFGWLLCILGLLASFTSPYKT